MLTKHMMVDSNRDADLQQVVGDFKAILFKRANFNISDPLEAWIRHLCGKTAFKWLLIMVFSHAI